MKKDILHIGTKLVLLTPMTRGEYTDYRGWALPEDEDGADQGYLVEYPGSPHKNHPNHACHISWSPKAEADAAYQNPRTGMSFGHAIEMAKHGYRITRAGWNGKGMWVVLMSAMSLPPYNTQGTERKVNDRTARWIGEDTPLDTLAYFAMWTVNSDGRRAWLPGWLASQTDMLADDWIIVD